MRKRAGRISLIGALALASVVGISVLLFLGGESPSSAAGKFMNALAVGDVDQLTELSFLDGNSPAELKKKWEFAVKRAGPHYRFAWKMSGSKAVDDDSANVKMEFVPNALSNGSYPSPYELSMQKIDGHWKVSIAEMSRKMYPGLPR